MSRYAVQATARPICRVPAGRNRIGRRGLRAYDSSVLRVAYFGPAGTFTEEALLTQADLAAATRTPQGSVPEVIAAVERGEADFRPTAAEPEVPEVFRMGAAVFPFEMEERLETPGYSVFAVRFPSPVVTPDVENNTVHAEYFRPNGSKTDRRRPAVVVLHILGADFALSRYIAARLADRGVDALFVKLPYYGERRPKQDEDKRFLSVDLDPASRPGLNRCADGPIEWGRKKSVLALRLQPPK